MNWEPLLEKIGLSSESSKIYITLLKHGSQSIISISKITGIHRPQIYRNIPHLRELGLITEITKGKRKIYKAESPENLEKIFEKTKSDFENGIHEMKKIYTEDSDTPLLRTLEGENFNFQVFEDLVKNVEDGGIVMRYSARKMKLNEVKYSKFKNISDTKNIQNLIISGSNLEGKKIHNTNDEVREIPKDFDLFEDNISKVVYKNKVAFIDYNKEKAYIIEDEKIARFEAKIFKLLFRYLQKNK